MNLSRRSLFGLFAGAASIPLLPKIKLPWKPTPQVDLVDLLEARIATAEQTMKQVLSTSLYGDLKSRAADVGIRAVWGDSIGDDEVLTVEDVQFAATYDWKSASASFSVDA